jgi:Protein-tyrosine phosphatase
MCFVLPCNCTDVRLQVAERAENASRNRYFNVLPFDDNRVRLAADGVTDVQTPKADYINASLLRSKDDEAPVWQYIATQVCPVARRIRLSVCLSVCPSRCACHSGPFRLPPCPAALYGVLLPPRCHFCPLDVIFALSMSFCPFGILLRRAGAFPRLLHLGQRGCACMLGSPQPPQRVTPGPAGIHGGGFLEDGL